MARRALFGPEREHSILQFDSCSCDVPRPLPVWRSLAQIAEMPPGTPLSRTQVDLMEVATIASAGMPGFAALAIEHALEQMLAGS